MSYARNKQWPENIIAWGLSVLAIAITGLFVSSCGGRPDTTSSADTASSSSSSGTVATIVSSSSSSSSSGTIATNPPLNFSFTLDGTGGATVAYTTPQISTDSTLVVRVTGSGGGAITIPNSNFSMNYYCVGYNVTVLGQTRSTGPIAVNGGNPTECPNDHVDLDFSSQLTAGHGPITVEVSAPEYDYYCEWYYYCINTGIYSQSTYGECEWALASSPQMYCPLHTVYKTHTVSGALAVEVDGTTLPAMQ